MFSIVGLQIKSILTFSRELILNFEQLHIESKTHLVMPKKEKLNELVMKSTSNMNSHL